MLVSTKWIESLFNENTVRLSPLDFRLTATSQFRLLALMCSFTNITINDLTNAFLQQQLVDAHMISRTSFQTQAGSLLSKLDAILDLSVRGFRAAQVVMIIVNENRIHSVFHTNAFHLSAPGSNTYTILENYYPIYDNASFNTVSI